MFINVFTVEMYKRYTELMSKNEGHDIASAIFYNTKIVQEMFGNRVSLIDLQEVSTEELLVTVKTIHFIAQEIISNAFADLLTSNEEIEQLQETSVFDEYDKENGYTEEYETQENPWTICSKNIDYLIKIAMRVLNNSYSQCMDTDVMQLLKYIKFEFETMHENR